MPIGEIRQYLDITQLNHQLYGQNSGFARDMLKRGLRVQTRAKRNVHSQSGRLRGSIQLATQPRVVNGVSTFAIVVGTDVEYAKWVHDGTGIFGPRRARIKPTRAKYLVFVNKSGRRIRVQSVIGQRGQYYLKKALRAAARGSG